MSVHLRPDLDTLPTHAQLLKATGIALVLAGLLLITAVLPAEYGIDLTGIGSALGLTALRRPTPAGAVPAAAAAVEVPLEAITGKPAAPAPVAVEASLATPVATANPAVPALPAGAATPAAPAPDPAPAPAAPLVKRAATFRTDALMVPLLPGEGAEVKADMQAGDSFVFSWTVNGLVDFDMHGEPADAPKTFTSYWKGEQQESGHGSFVAPFSGRQGWFWVNHGEKPVTVKIKTAGFYDRLYRPEPK